MHGPKANLNFSNFILSDGAIMHRSFPFPPIPESLIMLDLNSYHGLTHINENLYSVPLESIDVKSFANQDSKDFSFVNPRIIAETFDDAPIGLNDADMEYLKTSIQQKGLLTPLIGRTIGNKIHLINGHRRFIAINTLLKEEAVCFDNFSMKHMPAKNLYKNVQMKIFEGANDIEAYIIAFEEDKTKVKFGLGVEYKFVDCCLNTKVPEEKILEMTGNSQTWLDSVKSLLSKLNGDSNSDKDILDALFMNKMSIGAAKALADISDPQQRTSEYINACKSAIADAEFKKDKIEKQLKNIKKKQDNVKAQGVILESLGDIQGKKTADQILEEALAEEKLIKSKQSNISPVVTAHNLSNSSVGPRNGKKNKQKKDVNTNLIQQDSSPSAEENKSDISISKTYLVNEWLKKISNIENNQIDSIEVDEFVVEITTDLVNSLINDQDCNDFILYWSKEIRRKRKFAD